MNKEKENLKEWVAELADTDDLEKRKKRMLLGVERAFALGSHQQKEKDMAVLEEMKELIIAKGNTLVHVDEAIKKIKEE